MLSNRATTVDDVAAETDVKACVFSSTSAQVIFFYSQNINKLGFRLKQGPKKDFSPATTVGMVVLLRSAAVATAVAAAAIDGNIAPRTTAPFWP